MELIPFSQIDPDDSKWSEDQVEAAEFLSKLDWEGGVFGLLDYGGSDVFPEELWTVAQNADDALRDLSNAINDWAAARGVEY